MKPGWNRKGSTVHLDSTRDRINLRASKIHLQIEIPSLARGITDFLQPFGTFYHGYLQSDLFQRHYNLVRCELFQTLQTCAPMDIDHDWDRLKAQNFALFQRVKTAAFWLDMMRTCQNQPWRWPAMGEGDAGAINLINGRSRLMATGMTKRQSWKHMNFLIWVAKGRAIDGIIEYPRPLVSDKDLHEALGLTYDDQEYHQPEECHMGIEWRNGRIGLQFFNNAFDADFTPRVQQRWLDFVTWSRRYGKRPNIKIYTNWPHQIQDSANFWHYEIIGNSQGFIDNLLPGKPGSINWAMHNHIHGRCEHDHALWITQDQSIDLSDLVCWMDTKHNIFVDSEFRFALYRRDTVYNSVTVDITR
jgi:hypothetical protein